MLTRHRSGPSGCWDFLARACRFAWAGRGHGPLNVVRGFLDYAFNWARANSLWPLSLGLGCCAAETMAAGTSPFDVDRIGTGAFRAGPRHADVMIVAGTVTRKMEERIKTLYEQMPEPRWVISVGSCANSGGIYGDAYSGVKGVDQVIPVDVYVPGCPPHPEALIHGLIQLQEKIMQERRLSKPPARAFQPVPLPVRDPGDG